MSQELERFHSNAVRVVRSYMNHANTNLERDFWEYVEKCLDLELKYYDKVTHAKKNVSIYFQGVMGANNPAESKIAFTIFYNIWNPVRNNVETFDSIEEIRRELQL